MRSDSTESPPPAKPPVVASASFLLIVAGRTAQRRMEDSLAEHGLTLRHVGALGHLSRNPDLSYSDLARRAGVTAQSMHATVRGLEKIEAVRRHHEGHGHPARLEVTAHGKQLLATAAGIAARVDEELLGSLSPDRRAALAETLAAVALPPGR
ncbi:MarR family winged helix-turn-helix transcriptional regulator [Amycolatopsis anabasis]|uniref:MarR family winged helix-turn-helix transcriptional regulator n=1 Tax=Amycolatopsis anabasis TaxID=1840409 RepID=UPI00131DEAF8|nr:MarR family winged helix-turn-helix transcriptional regulator [Amycolatopsis anabasis]